MNPHKRAAMAAVVHNAHTAVSPRVEGIFLAFECQAACDLREARDRAHWPYGRAVWDEVYPQDAAAQIGALHRSWVGKGLRSRPDLADLLIPSWIGGA